MWRLLTSGRILVRVLVAAVLLGGASPRLFGQGSSAEAVSLLKKALIADQLCSYRGESDSETCYRGRRVKARATVLHRKPASHRIDYTSAPLAGMALINNGRYLWRVDPRHKTLTRTDSPRREDPRKLEALLANYRASLGGSQTIAGRKALVVTLVPRDSGKGGKKLWIDVVNGVQLGSEDYDSLGHCVSRSRFRSIDYAPNLPESVFAEPRPAGYQLTVLGQGDHTIAELSKELGFKVLVPAYLPGRYRLERAFCEPCDCRCGARMAHLRYGDGVGSLSILECAHCGGMSAPCKASSYGAAGVAVVNRGKLNISLIGNLSPEALRRIGESAR